MGTTRNSLLGVLFIGLIAFSGCRKPTACLDVDNTSPNLGETIQIINCSEKTETSEIKIDSLEDDIAPGDTMYHVFHEPGSYTAALTSYTKSDRQDDKTESTITVSEPQASEIRHPWYYYKIEEYDYVWEYKGEGELVTSTKPTADTLVFEFFKGDSVYVDGARTSWELKSSKADIVMQNDTTTYSIYKLHEDEMIWREEKATGYYLMYFTKLDQWN